MRFIVCVLVSIAIGAATYTLGAVIWSIADPLGASNVLLFTIPIAIAVITIAALLAVAILMLFCVGRRPVRNRKHAAPVPAKPSASPSRGHHEELDDLQFAA